MSPDPSDVQAPEGETFEGPTLLGHPRGLFVLFFAELWERFCYYGMRALLALYVVAQFHKPQEEASISYGAFTTLVYALGIFGGMVADRVLGYRRSIVLGGLFMAAGEFMLMIPTEKMFLYGLATLVVGNGMFKPNISSLVGKLYRPGDPRRDGGFTIFYMGINIGATIAPIACQWISEKMGTQANVAEGIAAVSDYRYGFIMAGAGMLLGLVCFGLGRGSLQGKGLPPRGRESVNWIFVVALGAAAVIPLMFWLLSKGDWVSIILFTFLGAILVFLITIAMSSEKVVRERLLVLVLLLVCNIAFWMAFEQSGNSLNFFAQQHIRPLRFGDWTMPFEWFQSVNAIFIVLLGPVFAALWVKLDERGMNPSIPRKFGLGLVQVALGFGLLVLAIQTMGQAGLVPWFMLMGLYWIHTMGELCLSPVGLSMVTKLAPEKMTGMIMGAWFISIAAGNNLAGRVSSSAARAVEAAPEAVSKINAYGATFAWLMWVTLGIGVLLFLLSPLINKWMHGVK